MRFRFLVIALTLATPGLRAMDIDYDRTDPVPADQPIPMQDFFRAPIVSSPVINSAGTCVAALLSPRDKTRLLIWDLARRKPDDIGGYGDTDVADVHWLDDVHVTYTLATEKTFSFASMVAEVGRLRGTYPLFEYSGSILVGVPPHDSGHPLFWQRGRLAFGGGHVEAKPGPVVAADALSSDGPDVIVPEATRRNPRLYEVAASNNQQHSWHSYPMPPGLALGYFEDASGGLGYGLTADGTGKPTMYRLEGERWIRCPVDLDATPIKGRADRAGQVVVYGPRTEGKPRALQYLDAATGKLGDVLYRDAEYDSFGSLRWDHARQRIVGVDLDRATPTTVWLDDRYRGMQQTLDQHFHGRHVTILSTSDDLSVALVAVDSDRQPAIYFTVDFAHGRVDMLNKSRPWVDASRMSPMHVLRFRTRDGIRLEAYLTLPPGASKDHPVPLVVFPHGGPFARDSWGYDPEVQFLAGLGYAVLQPNYRNSDGYDWRVPASDLFNFGRMTDDVSDAARAVLTTHLVDPKRVAIVGSSFGGYLAISGAAHDPSLYRCAVSIAGVFDWLEQIRNAKYDRYDDPNYVLLTHYLGDPHTDRVRLAAMSPINYISQVRVPVFVFHGKDDPMVDIGQSRALVAALERNGIPHETMFVAGEGHGAHHLDNEMEMWSRIAAFLRKNLRGSDEAAVR